MSHAMPGVGGEGLALRPWLRVALLATVVLAAVALWLAPDQVQGPMQGSRQGPRVIVGDGMAAAAAPAAPAGLAAGALAQAAVPSATWPGPLTSTVLEPAMHDPFVGASSTPPRAQTPPPRGAAVQALPPATTMAAAQPAVAAVPAVPNAPALSYRFFARLTSPAGTALTFVAKGDQVLQVQAGQRLDEGYVVEAVDEQAVRLRYPPLDVRAGIAIAPASVAPALADVR